MATYIIVEPERIVAQPPGVGASGHWALVNRMAPAPTSHRHAPVATYRAGRLRMRVTEQQVNVTVEQGDCKNDPFGPRKLARYR